MLPTSKFGRRYPSEHAGKPGALQTLARLTGRRSSMGANHRFPKTITPRALRGVLVSKLDVSWGFNPIAG